MIDWNAARTVDLHALPYQNLIMFLAAAFAQTDHIFLYVSNQIKEAAKNIISLILIFCFKLFCIHRHTVQLA